MTEQFQFPDKSEYKVTITKKLRQHLIDVLKSKSEPKYLEIGCDRGYTLITLSPYYSSCVAIDTHDKKCDISKSNIEKYVEKDKQDKIQIIECTMDTIPVKDKFDVILVDGSHDYKDVISDLKNIITKDLYNDNCVVVFHDYGLKYAGVKNAIHKIFHKNSYQFVGENVNWNPCGDPVDGPEAVQIVLTARKSKSILKKIEEI